MKWLKMLIWFSLFASCCPKYSAIPQEELVLSEKEVVFLARNCDYVELMCSERMINAGKDNEYKYDNIIVNILDKTDCFEGLLRFQLHLSGPSGSYLSHSKETTFNISDFFLLM